MNSDPVECSRRPRTGKNDKARDCMPTRKNRARLGFYPLTSPDLCLYFLVHFIIQVSLSVFFVTNQASFCFFHPIGVTHITIDRRLRCRLRSKLLDKSQAAKRGNAHGRCQRRLFLVYLLSGT